MNDENRNGDLTFGESIVFIAMDESLFGFVLNGAFS